MDRLLAAREAIDRVDRQMAALFEERMAAVEEVLAYKREHGLPVFDAGREAEVLQKNLALLTRPGLRPYYESCLRRQMEVSRQYQAAVLGRDTVAYQGVEGAFSQIALSRLFPAARQLACATWDEVFSRVEKGEAEYGVLPFENSHAGDVSAVLDLCFGHSLSVVRMYDLPVSQNLLGLPGARLADIREVYSHQQAIRQSERFLKSLGLPAVEWPNTAGAARHVAECGDKSKAAIASADTAALYGLEILAANISTDEDNTTRFIVVGRECPAAGNRFSLLFTVDHKAGRLARVIQAIGQAGFNMECIKSRPMPHVPFEYYFYAELVGDARAAGSQKLLSTLETVCRTVRILGIFDR